MFNNLKRTSVSVALIALAAFAINLGLPGASFAHHKNYYPTDASTTSVSMPERILLMRHAEKPDDENNPDLAPAGFHRAETLPKYILSQYGRPDYIFAAANSKKSSRPYETAIPLSRQSGVAIDTTFRDKDFEGLADVLRHDNRFSGKLIVVVWHHGNIPEFAQALHARAGDYPQEW